MPDPNVGQLVASTWERVVGSKPEDNIFNDLWLFNRLTTGGGIKRVDGGRLIEVPIEYAKNTTFRSYSDMETLDVNRVDVFDAARYDWKEHGGTVVISEIEKFRNMGEGRKFDVLAAKIDNAINSAKDSLNTAAFGNGTGNGGKDIHGLQQLVPDDPTTGTVGGINRATFSFWRSKAIIDTGTAFNQLRANMRSIYNQCSRGAFSEHPTTIITTRTVMEGYEGLLTANERFDSKESGDGGFKNEVLKFKGAKMAYDEACGADRMYFLNEKSIKLYVAKGVFLRLGEQIEPANQSIYVQKIISILNLIVTQSRRLGVISSIA